MFGERFARERCIRVRWRGGELIQQQVWNGTSAGNRITELEEKQSSLFELEIKLKKKKSS